MGEDAALKEQVRAFWDAESCGSRYLDGEDAQSRWEAQGAARYRLEPFIFELARFHEGRDKRVLEIGVGLGADSLQWLRAGADFTGIDLTPEAVRQCKERVAAYGFVDADIRVGDAEALPFEDATFDLVWSWGVLHHTPDTRRAFSEAARVLRPGGLLRAMVYHDPSWVNLMLWARHGALAGLTPREAAFRHLESPGTKCYPVREARELLAPFSEVLRVEPKLCPADLLDIKPSGKHQGRLDKLAWRFWPRPLVRAIGDRFGSFLLIEARK
jgi:SAM-dependent methyltransferase